MNKKFFTENNIVITAINKTYISKDGTTKTAKNISYITENADIIETATELSKDIVRLIINEKIDNKVSYDFKHNSLYTWDRDVIEYLNFCTSKKKIKENYKSLQLSSIDIDYLTKALTVVDRVNNGQIKFVSQAVAINVVLGAFYCTINNIEYSIKGKTVKPKTDGKKKNTTKEKITEQNEKSANEKTA